MSRNVVLLLGAVATLAVAELYHGPLGASQKLEQQIERTARAELDRNEMYQVNAELEERPMAIPFMGKLVATEYNQRLAMLAQEIEGPAAQYGFGAERSVENGYWQRATMNSFGFTIGGGTSEIQRNIIGERILGLAKSR